MTTTGGVHTDASLDDLELAYLEPDTDERGDSMADLYANWDVATGDDDARLALRGWLHFAHHHDRPEQHTDGHAWLERLERDRVHPSKRAIAASFVRSGDFGECGEQGRALSQSKLAEGAGASDSSAKRFLAWARRDGWLQATGHVVRFHQGKRATPLYRLSTPDMAPVEPMEPWEVLDWSGMAQQHGIPAIDMQPRDRWQDADLDDLEK